MFEKTKFFKKHESRSKEHDLKIKLDEMESSISSLRKKINKTKKENKDLKRRLDNAEFTINKLLKAIK